MRSTIARLFGKSPFFPLQSHMKKVSSCIKKLTEIFDGIEKKSSAELEKLVGELSKLEHEADLTKNDIRNHLPKSLFLPIDRSQFLEILSLQDKIADQAEDIGHLLTLYPMEHFGQLCHHFFQLFEKNTQAFWDVRRVIKELHDLIESSFGGIEAEKVKTVIERTSYSEYEADKLKHKFMKDFFKKAQDLPTPVFYLYIRLIEEINQIAHVSERLANRVRMVLELK